MKSAAVLIGINYIQTPQARLNGCINDVKYMKKFLKKSGFDRVSTYTDDNIRGVCGTTRRGILYQLYSLAALSHREDLELAWFQYSGHGSYMSDNNGDEADGKDESLVPSDYHRSGMIRDDTIRHILKSFNPKTKVVFVIDACHSSSMGDLKYRFISKNDFVVENENAACPSKIISISGCLDRQTSADCYNINGRRQYSGAMTSCLLMALKDDDCRKDVFKLVEKMRELLRERQFSQIPQLCASYNINDDIVLFDL